MPGRFLLLFAIAAAPLAFFAGRSPWTLAFLLPSAAVAWLAASPVSWPAWLRRGLARTLPWTAALSLFLWWMTR